MVTKSYNILSQTEASSILNDEMAIIERTRKNPRDFEPLYNQYFKPIYTFIYARVQDYDIAGDLCSMVFLKALKKIDSYSYQGVPFSAWLYKIAFNECNQYFRKTRKSPLVFISYEQAQHLSEELIYEELEEDNLKEFAQRLPQILHQLKTQERELIELRFFAGKPFQEIAYLLGISVNLAKVKTHRTLKKMKKLFSESEK